MMKTILRAIGLTSKPKTLFEMLWLGVPVAVWFSFQPLIRFGKDTTMYFELSMAVVYLAVLALAGISVVWRHRRALYGSFQARLVGVFVLLSATSLIWDANLTRGILTLGVIGTLAIVFLASLAKIDEMKKLVPILTRLFIISAVVMSILSFVQFFIGIWLSRDITLLCAGCVAEQFGFARPNVFTIEPQFFGNLLIAPGLLLLHFFLSKKREVWLTTSLIVVVTALCLTLSRGALFAFAVGVLILFVLHYQVAKRVAASFGILITSFLISLCMQGMAAELNPTVQESFGDAVGKTVNQLSLGIIDISVEEVQPEVKTTSPKAVPKFDGYVAESTSTRVGLSELAIRTWSNDPFRILFGVGVGGSGAAMHQTFPHETDARQIVQNEYLEILLEMGLIGFTVFIAVITGLLYRLRKTKWLWAIVGAHLVQWNFFSGYPNALHIYLVFILCAVYVTAHRDQSAPAKQS